MICHECADTGTVLRDPSRPWGESCPRCDGAARRARDEMEQMEEVEMADRAALGGWDA